MNGRLQGTSLATLLLLASFASPAVAQSHESEATHPGAESESAGHHAAHVEHAEHTEHAEHEEHAGGHRPHHRYQFGLAGTLLVGLTEHGPMLRRGGGIAFAVSIVSHLEIEAVVHALIAEEGYQFPIDLLLKRAFVVTHWLHPFVGIGPTVVPYSLPERSGLLYGLATAAGFDIWLNHTTAVSVEFSYNILHGPDVAVEHEVGLSAGPLIGW